MTTAAAARDSLDAAQKLLDQVTADNARAEEFLSWLADAGDRADQLAEYIADQGPQDIEAVLAEDAAAITPPVGNEDAAWEALTDHHDGLLRILRAVTEELTAGVDDED